MIMRLTLYGSGVGRILYFLVMPNPSQYSKNPERYRLAARRYYAANQAKILSRLRERFQFDLEFRQKRLARALEQGERRKQQNQEFVRALKETTPCMDCGQKFPACCMDFDHRPGTKKWMDIAQASSSRRVTKNRLLTELQKCDIVCACCHRLRTYKRNQDE